ncbi:hypothetical protein AALO_G00102710 [Alosa alosa]|uniref:Uncharacterized protein n=1 Tax=Alosa alosa TaxID=278164 RepID=A0AAV6GZ68_9TELE|nr:hypothetical protein AALO_G00102710 [Alosa alosa]
MTLKYRGSLSLQTDLAVAFHELHELKHALMTTPIGRSWYCSIDQSRRASSDAGPVGQAGGPLPPSQASSESPAGQAGVPLPSSPSAQFSTTFQTASSESLTGQAVGPFSHSPSSTSSDRPISPPRSVTTTYWRNTVS